MRKLIIILNVSLQLVDFLLKNLYSLRLNNNFVRNFRLSRTFIFLKYLINVNFYNMLEFNVKNKLCKYLLLNISVTPNLRNKKP